MGYSVGGVIAYEAARQLIEQGEEVQHLILLDTACPALFPPFPLSLRDFLDEIDRFKGTCNVGDDTHVPGSSPTNSANKMRHPHIVATLRCLRQYNPIRIPESKELRTTLVAARKGVDGERKLSRPNATPEDDAVISWVLNDRDESRIERDFGWNRLIKGRSIEVVYTDGNHFSLMTEPYASHSTS